MKNLGVFSLKLFFFIDTSLGETRKSIYHSIGLVLLIINSKIIPGELLGPFDLTRAQVLHIHKLTVVIMISWNEYFIFAAF